MMLQGEGSRGEEKVGKSSVTTAGDATSRNWEVNDSGPTADAQEQVSALESSAKTFLCIQCNTAVLLTDQDEHDDWHFAKGLQTQEQRTCSSSDTQSPLMKESQPRLGNQGSSLIPRSVGKKRPHHSQARPKTERGQTRLVFDS